MNIYKKIESDVKAIAAARFPQADVAKVEATPTKDASHGDIATNAAMVLAAQVKANPKELAASLLEDIKKLGGVVKAEVAGPGFINMTLTPSMWQGLVPAILGDGIGYGDSSV